MVHYTFPPGASEIVSGVSIPEYVIEGGRAAYAYDDSTTEGVMYTIPNLPTLSGAMNYEIIGYASGTTGNAVFRITPYSYTPSAAASEGSWLSQTWGSASSFTVSAASGGSYQLSTGTLAYTPVSAITGDYFAFKVERIGGAGGGDDPPPSDTLVGDFRVVGVTLTF
tara:strand:- start:28 stop:528 length:501 start_codon:yes stop_codon:yes gene_type:complete